MKKDQIDFPPSAQALSRITGGVVALAITAGMVVLSDRFGKSQFGGYDLSPLVDLTYRLSKGQVPGRDFIDTLPLSFVVYIDLIQSLFGVSWNALLHAGELIFATTALILYLGTSSFVKPSVRYQAMLVVSIPLIVTNHVWHSVFTAYIAIIVLVGYLLALEGRTVGQRATGWLMSTALIGVLFYSKQNVGPPFVMVMSLCFIYRAAHLREAASLAAFGALVASIAVTTWLYIRLLGINLDALAYTFTAVDGRVLPSLDLIHAVILLPSNLMILAAAVALCHALFLHRKNLPRGAATFLLASALAVGLLAFITDWDVKYNNVALLFTPAVLALGLARRNTEDIPYRERRLNLTALTLTGLFLVAIWMGYSRFRMEKVGYGSFFERAPLAALQDSLFTGLRGGPRLVRATEDLTRFVVERPGLKASVFCGPRIEFCYAYLGAAPPAALPLWWHPGSSFALRDTTKIVQAFKRDHLRYLVFLDDDRTRMPTEILSYITQCYRRVQRDRVLELYERICPT